ncbi:MAG: translation initiation factor IF-2 N-terminal domain-containing protein, partial [Planctomycetaceae bacterium]|nr:translation initiation factor IF-2 N-terminal domain-containing protein [Planctomycetaceae bacterium]
MKIRIFALSKELDIDSKELIQHCLDAGLDVKSSALASITPEERDILMQHLETVQKAKPEVAATATPQPTMDRPTRPREIRTIGAAPPQLRRGPRKETATSEEQVAPVDDETPVDEEAVASVDEVTSPEVDDSPIDTLANEAQPEVETPAAVEATPAQPAATTTPADNRPAPINRSDYIAPGGGRGLGSIREMQARGNVREGGKKREKKGPALPSLAASPNFKLPTPTAKADEPVQKPDLALTGDVLKNNKLSEILRKKTKEDAKRRGGGDDDGDDGPATRGGARSGSLSLEEARAQRRTKRNRRRSDDDDDRIVHKSHKRSRRS